MARCFARPNEWTISISFLLLEWDLPYLYLDLFCENFPAALFEYCTKISINLQKVGAHCSKCIQQNYIQAAGYSPHGLNKVVEKHA